MKTQWKDQTSTLLSFVLHPSIIFIIHRIGSITTMMAIITHYRSPIQVWSGFQEKRGLSLSNPTKV